jgi:hypothetical protein
LRTFDHALLAGGALAALVAGATTAKLGLAPLDRAIMAQAALSLDTNDASAPPTIRASLSSDADAAPAPVIVRVNAPTAPKPPADTAADPAPGADEDVRLADQGDAGEPVTADPAPEPGPSPRAGSEARDPGEDQDPPAPALDPSADVSSTVAPG